MQRRPFLLTALTALTAASFLPALAGAAPGDPQVAVRNKIEVESVNGRALVHLTVYNYGKQTIWIPRDMAEEKELSGRRFDVRAFDGRPLTYTGKMVKRAALTAADYVIHMDPWWNPAVENQATDRAFRIGQRRNVQVYKMITAGTLEESIQDILDGKTQLAGAVVGEGEGWLTELDPDQLAALMSYRGRE